ncbi:MAG: acetylxylan esterase [Sedimentisphaerales bacterium]|nr:acetylxylan esterase [Sedimentisphaerales bacterium]
MKRSHWIALIMFLGLTFGSIAPAEEDLSVLPENIDGVSPSDMMKQYLLGLADNQFEHWKQQYEQRTTPEQINEYQNRLREKFKQVLGGFPERTPLNPKITGIISRNGYTVEKVIFESQPKHYVTGILFLPDASKHKPPYPGVLVPCGHSSNGKASNAYQTMGALLALNGMVGFVFDPIDQGERGQLLSQWPKLIGTRAHTMLGVGSILLGRNTARFEIWDGMRAIDYLQSRPEVDPERIGCTGNSGGGTQTSYLMSLDDRIIAAAPSCYITSLERLLNTIGPQDAEQNIFGQIAFGMDHADYLMMRAPTSILICAATKDFFDINGVWSSFRYAKRLYSRMGFAERIGLLENDATHNYNQLQRESVVRWMARWLLKKDEPITEPEITLLSEEEIKCAPGGQVMLMDGARSTYDLNRDYERELAQHRKKLWATKDHSELLEEVRRMAGIRKLSDLPKPEVVSAGMIQRDGYQIKKVIIKPEAGIALPALMFVPETNVGRPVLYLHEKGKDADASSDGPIEKLVKSGRCVLAVDLRGTGETKSNEKRAICEATGVDWKDVFMAYLLGRSYVGMRAEDILVCARFLSQEKDGPVDLISTGNVGVPALHAAALEPACFNSIKIEGSLFSWSSVVESGCSFNQQINAIQGALILYDLPNLAETLGNKLTIKEPLDALGKPS